MTTRAKEIMTTELILAHPEMTVEEAVKLLVNNRITGMPVVDSNRRLLGVVSEFDIIKTVQASDLTRPIDLKKPITFSKGAFSITENVALNDILTHFVERAVRRLPVVDSDGKLVGIISRRDIMRVLFYRAKSL